MSKNTRKDWERLYLGRFPEERDTGPAAGAEFWPIVPTPAPRQVQSDKWDPRPSVIRYRAFCREVQWKKVWAPTPGDVVYFLMPIPKSRRYESLHLTAHVQKPDADNLLKALLDACYGEDSHIWTITPFKVWSETPGIIVERREVDPGHVETIAGILSRY